MESKNPRPGQPERFARRDDLYRLLSRPVTISNKAEMGRLAAEAMKQPDFTPAGQDMSLHDLASDVGIEIEALRSRASRPGAKDTMASHKEGFQKEYVLWALPKGETDRLEERPIAEGITTPQQMDDAKRKAAAQGWHGFRVQILDMSKPFRWMSRPGAKDTMAVEDRFYFGKGRKERFA
jgi:hypothetical protein